jgi:hypothetical protein
MEQKMIATNATILAIVLLSPTARPVADPLPQMRRDGYDPISPSGLSGFGEDNGELSWIRLLFRG